jgi:hypothetical protein
MDQSRTKTKATGWVALLLLLASCSSTMPQGQAPPSNSTSPAQHPVVTPVEPSAESDPGCLLTPAQVQKTFAEWIEYGDVTINRESSGGRLCTFALPPGSLRQGDGASVVGQGSGPSIVIYRYPYDEGTIMSSALREYGGSTAQAVFTSASSVYSDIARQDGETEHFQTYPSIGGGLVTNGVGGFVLAGPGQAWYGVTITNTQQSSEYGTALVELAEAILAADASYERQNGSVPPSAVPATPDSQTPKAPGKEIMGLWRGAVTGDRSTYQIVAEIQYSGEALTATVHYPELNCRATWTAVGTDAGAVLVEERLLSGRCQDNVQVRLTTVEGQLQAEFNGTEIRSHMSRDGQ